MQAVSRKAAYSFVGAGAGRASSNYELITAGSDLGILHNYFSPYSSANIIQMVAIGLDYTSGIGRQFQTVGLRFSVTPAPFSCRGVAVEGVGDEPDTSGAEYLVPSASVPACEIPPCTSAVPLVFNHTRTQTIPSPFVNRWVDSLLETNGNLDNPVSIFVHIMCQVDTASASITNADFALFTLELRPPRIALIMDNRTQTASGTSLPTAQEIPRGVDASGAWVEGGSTANDKDFVVHKAANMFPMVHIRRYEGFLLTFSLA